MFQSLIRNRRTVTATLLPIAFVMIVAGLIAGSSEAMAIGTFVVSSWTVCRVVFDVIYDPPQPVQWHRRTDDAALEGEIVDQQTPAE